MHFCLGDFTCFAPFGLCLNLPISSRNLRIGLNSSRLLDIFQNREIGNSDCEGFQYFTYFFYYAEYIEKKRKYYFKIKNRPSL